MAVDIEAFKAQCAALVGFDPKKIRDGDELYGFFQDFRGNPERLKPLFNDSPEAREVYARLLSVYEAVSHNPLLEDGYVAGYFIVRKPIPATEAEALDLMERYLDRVQRMAFEEGVSDLHNQLDRRKPATVHYGTPPDITDESIRVAIYDVQCDWMRNFRQTDRRCNFLSEAFYSITCDYELANYLSMPWLKDISPMKATAPISFEFWNRGIEFGGETEDDIRVYLPEPT